MSTINCFFVTFKHLSLYSKLFGKLNVIIQPLLSISTWMIPWVACLGLQSKLSLWTQQEITEIYYKQEESKFTGRGSPQEETYLICEILPLATNV